MTRILVVQTAFLGDVVLTTPLLAELRRLQPSARIVVVAVPAGAEILSGHPAVSELLDYDKKRSARGARGLGRLLVEVRRRRFTVAVAAQRSVRSGLVALLSGARMRVGFRGAPGAWAYTDAVEWRATDHAVRRYLALSRPLGGDPSRSDPRPTLAVDPQAVTRVCGLLRDHGAGRDRGIVSIAPGSIWGTKRWTPTGFAEVARAVRTRGSVPVLVGSPEEEPLCREIASMAGDAPVLAGRTGIGDLAALLSISAALVTNDSGPGHVAAALGIPVVAVFGPTVPAFGYTPFGEAHRIVEISGLDCRPCDRHGPAVCPLGHHRCMRDIRPDTVIEALDDVLR